jgi:putative PIN family toxin of toxin-antitoxin system
MRLVIDTNVIVAALGSRNGASNRLLMLGTQNRFQLLVSTALLLEYEAVLTRDPVRSLTGLDRVAVGEALNGLCRIAQPVTIPFRTRPILRDPNDEMVLETAYHGSADWIVTFNSRDFEPARELGIGVDRPGALVQRFGKDC